MKVRQLCRSEGGWRKKKNCSNNNNNKGNFIQSLTQYCQENYKSLSTVEKSIWCQCCFSCLILHLISCGYSTQTYNILKIFLFLCLFFLNVTLHFVSNKRGLHLLRTTKSAYDKHFENQGRRSSNHNRFKNQSMIKAMKRCSLNLFWMTNFKLNDHLILNIFCSESQVWYKEDTNSLSYFGIGIFVIQEVILIYGLPKICEEIFAHGLFFCRCVDREITISMECWVGDAN